MIDPLTPDLFDSLAIAICHLILLGLYCLVSIIAERSNGGHHGSDSSDRAEHRRNVADT